MCSIFGVLGSSPENVRVYSNLMRHRGPDDSGEHIDAHGRFCFFHNRLSFLDLSSRGSQPSISRNSVLIFNGEIYNFRDLNGTFFPNEKFDSDTVLLQRIIEKVGVRQAIDLVQGMYAFAFYDLLSDVGYLARDGHGEKPLYYLEIDNSVYFGSEIKSLVPLSNSDIDEASLLSYIQFGFVNNKEGTIYQNIKRVLPGELIIFDNHETRHEFSRVSVEFSSKKPRENAVIFEDLFLKSVQRSCVSDVPLSLLFSGGLDSTAVLLAMRELGYSPDVFTLGFANKGFDESARALRLAKQIGVNVNVVDFNEKNLIHKFEDAYAKFDEPLADVSIIPLNDLYAVVGDSYKGVLTGDGGDEYQKGYSRHAMLDSILFNSLKKFPLASKKLIAQASSRSKLLSLIYGDDSAIMASRLSKLKVMIERDFSYQSMFGSPFSFENARHEEVSILRILERDICEYLPNNIFYKSDTLSMSHSVESRSPFVQQELTNWLSRNIPNNSKEYTKGFIDKYLMTQYPASVKRGFVSPVKTWLENDLREDYMLILSHFGILYWAAVGDDNFRWRIYVLCKWLIRNGFKDFPLMSIL